MADTIPPHYHCMICMKAIPTSETLCSDECKQKYQAMLKKKRLTILLLWVMMIAFIVILFLYEFE